MDSCKDRPILVSGILPRQPASDANFTFCTVSAVVGFLDKTTCSLKPRGFNGLFIWIVAQQLLRSLLWAPWLISS